MKIIYLIPLLILGSCMHTKKSASINKLDIEYNSVPTTPPPPPPPPEIEDPEIFDSVEQMPYAAHIQYATTDNHERLSATADDLTNRIKSYIHKNYPSLKADVTNVGIVTLVINPRGLFTIESISRINAPYDGYVREALKSINQSHRPYFKAGSHRGKHVYVRQSYKVVY